MSDWRMSVRVLMSQDCAEVNLYGIAARYIVMVVDKKIVGIAS